MLRAIGESLGPTDSPAIATHDQPGRVQRAEARPRGTQSPQPGLHSPDPGICDEGIDDA